LTPYLPSLLWLSNSANVPSGYGNQTKLFTPHLKQQGYPIAVAAMFGAEGFAHVDEHGIEQLPRLTNRDVLMHNVIEAHMRHVKADVCITFLDAWALKPNVYGKLNWCAWAPIDSTPMKPWNKDTLPYARWIWAMSKHGLGEMEKAGWGAKTMYVPLATDTGVFKPINREEARRRLGEKWKRDLTGKFFVVMNSANKGSPSRKGFYEALKAFTEFSKDRDDALLYLHTDMLGLDGGEEIATILELVGCDPKKILFPPQYDYQMALLTDNYLNHVYNAADVFLSTSHGEGFGIPIIEAQAAGCPVILTDCTAMTELCLAGILIEKGTDFMSATGSLQRIPDVGEVVQALKYFYYRRSTLRGAFSAEWYRKEAWRRALDYDYRTVFDTYMKPALDRIADDLAQEKAVAEHRAALRSKYAIHGKSSTDGEHPDADAQPVGADDSVPRLVGADATRSQRRADGAG
jgi:glycosyltransferase involved in cell wall biosynthesis